MAYSIDYINLICTDLGGTGGHAYEIDGMNEICTLIGATAGHSYNIDALNAICTALGYTAGHEYNIDALNAICVGGAYIYEDDAWQAIQVGSKLNYCSQYKTILENFTTKPSVHDSYYYNRMVRNLVNYGIWAKLDLFNFMGLASNNNNDALINWINPTTSGSLGGSTNPSFTAYRGFTGNISEGAYILSGFIPRNATKATNNNTTFGFVLRDDVASGNAGRWGVYNNGNLQIILGSGAYSRIYDNTTDSYSLSKQNGYFAFVREDANVVKSYQDGVLKQNHNQAAATTMPLMQIAYLALNYNGSFGNFSSNTIVCGFFGASLSQTEIQFLNNEIEKCLDGVWYGLNPDIVLSIIGDSISGTDSVDWPSKVETYIYSKYNHSVPGEGIISGMDAMVVNAASDNADIIIVALGRNDNNGGDMSALQAEVEENISELKTSNPSATIYYMNVLPCWTDNTGVTEVNMSNVRAAISAACLSKNITCWDSYNEGWIVASDTSDGTHTTADGAVKLWDKIKTLI